MVVTLIQPLGEMYVYLKTPCHLSVVAQRDSDAHFLLDERVTIHFDPNRIHFFEPGENGKILAMRTGSVS